MFRNAFFAELRTTGREANNPDSDRANTTFRGYNAIETLFPGAQKRADEALADGESRWTGDFETYAGPCDLERRRQGGIRLAGRRVQAGEQRGDCREKRVSRPGRSIVATRCARVS